MYNCLPSSLSVTGVLDRLPKLPRLVLASGASTLFFAGLLDSWSSALILFLGLVFIEAGRSQLAARARVWSRIMEGVPVVIRLLAAFAVAYFLSTWLLANVSWGTSFQPLVWGLLISLPFVAIAFPEGAGGLGGGPEGGAVRSHSRLVWRGIAFIYLFFILPSLALADNCSGLTDCYGTILAAVLAILGLALVIAAPYLVGGLAARFAVGGMLRVLVAVGRSGRIMQGLGGLFRGSRVGMAIGRAIVCGHARGEAVPDQGRNSAQRSEGRIRSAQVYRLRLEP